MAHEMSSERVRANNLLAEFVGMAIAGDRKKIPHVIPPRRIWAKIEPLDLETGTIVEEGLGEVFGDSFRRRAESIARAGD